DCEVKHGERVQLYNLYFGAIGNPKLPQKLQKRSKKILLPMIMAACLLGAAVVAWLIFGPGKPPSVASTNTANTNTLAPVGEKSLSYWLLVQKCRGNRESDCAAPFPLAADATYIFEENYRVRLNVATPQPGYFYVLNELADKVEGTPMYKIL